MEIKKQATTALSLSSELQKEAGRPRVSRKGFVIKSIFRHTYFATAVWLLP